MKKFLSLVSLLIVAMMILAMPTVSAAENNAWTKPEGVNVHYANDVSGNAPSVDGFINPGEYGANVVKIEEARATQLWGSQWQTDPVDPTLCSESMEVYYAYDEENIYFAIYEIGPAFVDNGDEAKDNDVVYRNNYTFKIGFDLNDVKKYFQFGGFRTNVEWANLSYFEEDGVKVDLPIGTASIITECIVKKTDYVTNEDVAYGDLISANGNPNYTKGQWSMTMEFKISKVDFIQTINDVYGTQYNNLSNAMWMVVDANSFKKNPAGGSDINQYFKWIGQNDISGKQDNYVDYGILEGMTKDSLFDVIVFGDANTVIKVASPEGDPVETEPPVTEPAATEPAATEDVAATEPVADATEPAATDPATESGCGGAVSFAGLALVAALGTCTVFVAKKKED